jgi:lipoprotein-releasing system permease protein
MKLPFSLFIALRYLKPKRAFLSIITLISILGVTLAITVLIVVISVMTGFSDKFQDSLLGFKPHLTISSDNGPMQNWREVMKIAQGQPGVVAAAPLVKGFVIVEKDDEVMTPMIRGIDPVAEQKVNDLKKFIKEGKFDLSGDDALIGTAMADSLGVKVGDKITVYAPNNIQGVVEELQREENDPNAKAKTLKELKDAIVLPQDLTVTGIFESGRYEYDSSVVLVPLYVGQELYELGDGVHDVSVRTTDPNTADRVEAELNTKLPQGDVAVAWMNGDDKSRMGAIKFEHNIMFIILMFLVIIAAFCVMNTLITVTVQKRREIGILKALGANVRQIVLVFLAQGMVVGFFGNVTGLALGMTVVTFRNEFKGFLERILHIQIFPQDVYEFSKIPAHVVPAEMAVICISAFVICSLAALIPAWFAARLDPVKALRYE